MIRNRIAQTAFSICCVLIGRLSATTPHRTWIVIGVAAAVVIADDWWSGRHEGDDRG